MKKTVLAIDDNRDFLDTMEHLLTGQGYNMVCLEDPLKTEDYIKEHDPGLLIIDIFMPERSGFNIIEDFREKGLYKDLPKIFLTCLDDDVEKMTAKACGVDHYLTKPVRHEELIGLVKEIMEN